MGSPRFEGKENGGRRKNLLNPTSPRSHGGISISNQRTINVQSSPRPMGSRGGRIPEYISTMVTGANPRGIRYHVDSLVLRGKKVASALEEASESCEGDSEFRGQSVMKDADFGGMAELPYEGFVVDHGLAGNNLETAVPNFVGAGPSMVRKISKEGSVQLNQ
ncbi:hypothetical protein COLO4_16455 [Corchorus olitorius]|uniref:Uncharacterized protein n=1 Tax=Corchorus olitorius TaxID=93759 RepID=A0A1R3JH98_9ROSI|nr:hypothetical protein COLO4_16455 [Corchorus olitorius]